MEWTVLHFASPFSATLPVPDAKELNGFGRHDVPQAAGGTPAAVAPPPSSGAGKADDAPQAAFRQGLDIKATQAAQPVEIATLSTAKAEYAANSAAADKAEAAPLADRAEGSAPSDH